MSTTAAIFDGSAVTDTAGAARYIGDGQRHSLSPHTLECWRSAGIGPKYTLVGTTVKYTKASLDEYLAAQTVDPAVGPPAGMLRRSGGPGGPKRVKSKLRHRMRARK